MTTQTIISSDERRVLLQSYKRLLQFTADIRQPDDIVKIKKLMSEASESVDIMHFKAPGFSGLRHSIEVAQIVVEEVGLGRTSVICALLYDTMQIARIPREEIKNAFGEQVAFICDGLMKVAELYERHTSIENDNFRKLLFTFAQDLRVILVILAERLNLMRHLKLYSEEDQRSIGSEVGYLYAPMAHRMGLYRIKSEMEDLAMKFTNRQVYNEIARKLNETKRSRDAYIDNFINPLKEVLLKHGFKFEIKGRTKTINSIYNKLKKSNVEFEQVYDLFAIRVILDCDYEEEKSQCWRVYSIVTDMYQPNPTRLRDWISVPKSNGYECLHTTVLGPENKWVEVQIRTRRMDEIAEKGFAAHWKYKGIKTEKSMENWLGHIREILENPELNAIDFIDDFKLDLYDKEVFVFTPKGDLKRLPKGSTVLDFAFDIHSNIGRRCVGAIVNQRNVPIRYELKNGDQVEILTSNHQEPKQDWLNIVVTSRAKTKLKQALKEQMFKQSEFGREMLVRRLKNWKYELTDTLLSQLMRGFGYKDIHVFLCDVGNEKISAVQVKDYIQQLERKEDEQIEAQKSTVSADKFVKPDEELTNSSSVLTIDKNLSGIDFQLAKCCNPIFGDPVFGFVSVSGGIKIHRIGCPNEADMRSKFGYRIVRAQWSGTHGNMSAVTLRVTGSDDIGIVTNITQLLGKDQDVRLRSITVDSSVGGFLGTVTVLVNSTDRLESLVKKIKAVKGVYTVDRIGN